MEEVANRLSSFFHNCQFRGEECKTCIYGRITEQGYQCINHDPGNWLKPKEINEPGKDRLWVWWI